jgi:hypothetical protein
MYRVMCTQNNTSRLPVSNGYAGEGIKCFVKASNVSLKMDQ